MRDTILDTMRGPQPTRLWNMNERYHPRCGAVSQASVLTLIGGNHLSIAWSGGGPPPVLVRGKLTDRRSWAPRQLALARHYQVARCDLRRWGRFARTPATIPRWSSRSTCTAA